MENTIYKRLFKLVIKYWPYLLVSTITAFIYVALNSMSVWLTASLINNILSDFDKLVNEQTQWINSQGNSERNTASVMRQYINHFFTEECISLFKKYYTYNRTISLDN
jgi:ABC-type multidrug transport system fused ATPase/permease subunit